VLTARVQRLFMPRGISADASARLIQATEKMRDSPEGRAAYFKGMLGAWMTLEAALIVVMGVVVAVVKAVDVGAVRAAAAVSGGLSAFCIGGVLCACRWYFAARRATREGKRHGTSSPEYRQALARATSSGRTVPYQIALGIAVLLIVLLN
jgi:hypothetical protein